MAKSKGNSPRKTMRCPVCCGDGWLYRNAPMRICSKCKGQKRIPNPDFKP